MGEPEDQEMGITGIEVQGADAHGGQIGVVLLPDMEVDLNREGSIEVGPVEGTVHNLLGPVHNEGEILLRIGLSKRHQFQVDDAGLEKQIYRHAEVLPIGRQLA